MTTKGSARPRVGIGTSVAANLFLIFGERVMNRATVRKRPPMGRSGAARRHCVPLFRALVDGSYVPSVRKCLAQVTGKLHEILCQESGMHCIRTPDRPNEKTRGVARPGF